MRVAIMQPYFFPYIGYFQLMSSVDIFIVLDDVQYIERGWVNRNRIRSGEKSSWLTLPVHGADRCLAINQREYMNDEKSLSRIRAQVHQSYRLSPAYGDIVPIFEKILGCKDRNVAHFNSHLLTVLAVELGLECSFISSSSMQNQGLLKGQVRILDLCKQLGAKRYINPIGGLDLYDSSLFEGEGVELRFIRTTVPPVSLSCGPTHLSIIDGLMQGGISACRRDIDRYELLTQ